MHFQTTAWSPAVVQDAVAFGTAVSEKKAFLFEFQVKGLFSAKLPPTISNVFYSPFLSTGPVPLRSTAAAFNPRSCSW